jgi:SWIM zinc finger
VDSVLNSISSRISTLRSVNKNKTGVVPACYEKLNNHWTTCATYKVFKTEENGNKYKVTPTMKNGYQTNHVIHVNECFCSCGTWKEYGYTCVDAMAYFRFHEEKRLWEVMSSKNMLAISASTHIIVNL